MKHASVGNTLPVKSPAAGATAECLDLIMWDWLLRRGARSPMIEADKQMQAMLA